MLLSGTCQDREWLLVELASSRHHIAWIISTSQIQNPSFIFTLKTFHSSSATIFLFADNTSCICHTSEFLDDKFGITVQGNYHAEKTLTYKDDGHLQTGPFSQHEIFTGIANLLDKVLLYVIPCNQQQLMGIVVLEMN